MLRTDAGCLDNYYDMIRDSEPLTAEQERALGAAACAGDREARDRIVAANMRLVVVLARPFMGRGLPIDDLIGEGVLGLIRAAELYDPEFGTRFSTYASYWIKEAIRHALNTTGAAIRLPAHMIRLLTAWRHAEQRLAREYGAAPTADEVADELGLSAKQREMVEKAIQSRKFDADDRSQEYPGGVIDALDAGAAAPFEASEEADDRDMLLRRLPRLDGVERTVIDMRYGLGGSPTQTYKEIGCRIGMSREWTRKVELRAMAKLAAAS